MRVPQEVPERAALLLQAVAKLGMGVLEPPDRGLQPLMDVHGAAYLAFLQSAHANWKRMPLDWGDEVISNVYVKHPNALRGVLAQAACYLADGSCPVGEMTWRSAYWSAQSALASADDIMGGSRFSYALCRPPGHHARGEAAGGFCYLNNAAIAAQALRAAHDRVLILDIDMHHGQGIQEIFYERADVCYVSIHGDPTNYYPVVAGFDDETGAAAGAGFNLNLPLPHGSDEPAFFAKLDTAAQRICAFNPGAVVLAFGFDIYREDPQAVVDVSSEGFRQIGRCVRALNLPTLIVQEGGYHLESLQRNADCFFGGLLDG